MEGSYKPLWNLKQLSVCTKIIPAKSSSTTSMGKILNFNQVHGCVTLLPLSSFRIMRS